MLPHTRHTTTAFDPNQTLLIDTANVNWGLIRAWLDDCGAKHQSCTSLNPDDQPLHGFQVIDCETRSIIPLPPGGEYAALSYVWGTSSSASSIFQVRLPPQTPQTIEDAIICTQALGLRYLWIDRVCIDQSDTEAKHNLIQRMHQVYHNASITIVNEAGEGPNCGLPGVSSRSRQWQHVVNIHGVEYSTLPCPREDLLQSIWSRRGCRVSLNPIRDLH
jgi:hypothetical protein